MSLIKHSAYVNYSASQMYNLVNAVETYPQFLPWCKSIRVQQRYQNIVVVAVEIAKGGLHKTCITRNTSIPDEKIVIDLMDGPFENLSGDWEFKAVDLAACRINFCLSFNFTNQLMALIMQPVVSYIANTMVEAFTRRAREVYGEN